MRLRPLETGGVLLGYYDFNLDMVVVVDALPAPPDSKTTTKFFERGVQNLSESIEEASKRNAGVVQYIGEWHSHPPGHSATPSQMDLRQLAYLAEGMDQDGLSAFSLIVSENDLQILKGEVIK